MQDFKKITIIGTGLIGGSIGLAIKNLSDLPKIIGVDKNEEILDRVIDKGAIDEGSLDISLAVKDADLVFIAAPVGKIIGILKKISPFLKKGTIVTDVGSTKLKVVCSAESILPKGVFFIGGHPMTGSENNGIEAANADLFKNNYYILTPTVNTDTAAFQKLHSLINSIGANVIAIDASKHDKIVATISHLPHILASSLMNLTADQTKAGGKKENWLQLAAGGFRDTTRIAASSSNIWLDICLENKEAILSNLKDFSKVLDNMMELIKNSDRSKLRKQLDKARKARVNMPITKQKDLTELKELLVPVSDKPGVISDITVTFGQLGINIEDIEIVHSAENRGVLRLAVNGEKEAIKAQKTLKDKGYSVEVRETY